MVILSPIVVIIASSIQLPEMPAVIFLLKMIIYSEHYKVGNYFLVNIYFIVELAQTFCLFKHIFE